MQADPVDPHRFTVKSCHLDQTMQRAQKITAFETDRVDKHENIRERQLELTQEARVLQILKEKQDQARWNAFKERMQEEQEMQTHNFQTIQTVRDEHYKKVQSKYKHLDDLGYAAHKEHMVEVE